MTEVFNVGADDYNSYIIQGEKNILIDTVPERFKDEYIEKLPEKVDILVMTRTTPDSAGCVQGVIEKNPEIQVYSTVAGLKNLKEITNMTFNENLIKNEGVIETGDDVLKFFIMPNLSWPDTCTCYLVGKKALFSGNLFCESPETDFFTKEFLSDAAVRISELEKDIIYPGYKSFKSIHMYDAFLEKTQKEQHMIIYGSYSGQTKSLAECIYNMLTTSGKKAVLYDCDNKNHELQKEIDNCTCLFVGTSTINHNAQKSVLDVVSGINVIKNSGKPAFVFGSYGFSGEGTNIIAKLLGNLKFKVNKRPYRCILNPSVKNFADLESEVKEFLEGILDA